MKSPIIFTTKLNQYNDYAGFEFSQLGTQLTAKDKKTIDLIAANLYNSYQAEEQTVVRLSIGEVTIRSSPHPTIKRRKVLEGYMELPDDNDQHISKLPQPNYVEIQSTAQRTQEKLKQEYISILQRLLEIRFADNTSNQATIEGLVSFIIDEIDNPEVKVDIDGIIVNYLKIIPAINSRSSDDNINHLANIIRSKLLESKP